MPASLYTQAEIKALREKMVKEQGGIDPILNEPSKEPFVLDHNHSSQHCRAALGRNSNAFEGLVTNAYKRCLSWLTDKPLPEILRNLALYLERDYTGNPYHPSWSKFVKARFNRLNSKEMKSVLEGLGRQDGKNLTERKKIFQEIVLDRKLGYEIIISAINKVKESNE